MKTAAKCLINVDTHLMVYGWLGQRRDGEREQPAVAVFVHNLLQNQTQGKVDVRAVSLNEFRLQGALLHPVEQALGDTGCL